MPTLPIVLSLGLLLCTLPHPSNARRYFLDCDPDKIGGLSTFTDPDDVCDPDGYLEDRRKVAYPLALIGLIVLLSCPLFFICRKFNLCGGYGQHPGICRGDRSMQKVYTKKEVMATKIAVVAFVVLIEIGAIITIIGTAKLKSSMDEGFDTVIALAGTVREEVEQIEAVVNAIQVDIDSLATLLSDPSSFKDIQIPTNTFSTAFDAVDSVEQSINDAGDEEVSETDMLILASYIISISNLVITLFACVMAGIAFHKCFPYAVLFFLFLGAATVCFLAGSYLAVTDIARDFCLIIDDAIEFQENLPAVSLTSVADITGSGDQVETDEDDKRASILHSLFQCNDPSTWGFQDLQRTTERLEKQIADKACTLPQTSALLRGTFCSQLTFDCSDLPSNCVTYEHVQRIPQLITTRNGVSCTTLPMLNLLNSTLNNLPSTTEQPTTSTPNTDQQQPDLRLPFPNTKIQPQQSSCSVEQCATQCTSPLLRVGAEVINSLVKITQRVEDVLHARVIPLINCSFIFDRLLHDWEAKCDRLRKAIALCLIGCLLQCIGCLLGIPIVVVATKRCAPQSTPQGETMTPSQQAEMYTTGPEGLHTIAPPPTPVLAEVVMLPPQTTVEMDKQSSV
eukprot:TRINITY_DN76675_c0_g1_i1.p1 TRINITY_DN76675_c0_g1~~TRINITY_DN76675_c0_g1_i1.p1  ORF type:complete len:650 (+),score=40.34 TRINITY_DN76675_c0_g1_i1:85-1950(+)